MLDRRSFLLAGVAGAMATRGARSQTEASVPLWPGPPPGGGGPVGPRYVSSAGAVSNIAVPTLDIVVPARPNGAAVLVAAGGGYKRIGVAHEAEPAATWLADHGVTAFVLTYRLPDEGWTDGPLAPLQDAQRALRLMRTLAMARKLDPGRVGVLGFSAGGHLLGLASARSTFASYTPVDATDQRSARPDFAALLYPVVTLAPPYDRTSTCRALIGRNPSPTAIADWSVETHVGVSCPPMFLANAADDPIAVPAHCNLLQAACRQAGVPAELQTFSTGGHGFAMGRPGSPTAAWPDLYRDWLSRLHVLN